jgi:hypothetical protein
LTHNDVTQLVGLVLRQQAWHKDTAEGRRRRGKLELWGCRALAD